jgi:putative phage-type endonuclease
MTAKLLMTQDEIERHPDEWAEYRESGIGASEMAVLLGIAPRSYGNPYALYVEKTTGKRVRGDDEEDEMARGKALEPYVASRLAAKRPNLLVLPGGLYRHPDNPWMTATFDRLAVDWEAAGYSSPEVVREMTRYQSPFTWPQLAGHIIPAELKTAITKDGWGEPGSEDIPRQYRPQALWQMAISGAPRVLVPVQFMTPWRTEVYEVHRTEDAELDIAFMIKEAQEFLERLDRHDPPPIDWSPETSAALRTLYPMEPETVYQCTPAQARALRRAYLRKEAAKERYGLLMNKLVGRSKGAHRVVTADPERPGKTVNVLNRVKTTMHTVNVEALRDQEPDTAKRFERETPVEYHKIGSRWVKLDG